MQQNAKQPEKKWINIAKVFFGVSKKMHCFQKFAVIGKESMCVYELEVFFAKVCKNNMMTYN